MEYEPEQLELFDDLRKKSGKSDDFFVFFYMCIWTTCLLLLLVFINVNQTTAPEPRMPDLWQSQDGTTHHRESIDQSSRERNAYLQDPLTYLARAKESLQILKEKDVSGKLELPSREQFLREQRLRESEFARNLNLKPAPQYIQKLFELVVDNYPINSGLKNLVTFNLRVCHGLEEDCGLWTGGTFAMPYGAVQLSLELIAFAQNEAELVGLMGHEISHIVHEDSRKYQGLYTEYEAMLRTSRFKSILSIADPYFLTKIHLREQIRADLSSLEVMQKLGYNPCAFAVYGERLSFEKERSLAMRDFLPCKGKLWQVKNEEEFIAFKREYVRIETK